MRLFIPGPVTVSKDVNKAIGAEMIGHRGKGFQDLFGNIAQNLGQLLYTKNRVLISTSSGSGLMEGAIRNCVSDTGSVLVCSCGAFGKKWFDIAKSCGKQVDLFEIEAGKGFRAEELAAKLAQKKYEAVCVTHNETSTGVMNHLEELSPVIHDAGALMLVDAVSSMGGAKIEVDKIGIDVCLSSSQKCFSLPPGLSVAAVSEAALEKAKTVKGRGYYFDFVELAKEYDTKQTPYTPAVGLFFGKKHQLDKIMEEGLDKRFARHEKMARATQKWALKNGFELFAEKGYRSSTVTCISNTKKIALEEVKKKVKEKGYIMDAGYRKLNDGLLEKGRADTFRIPHMGDLKMGELKKYLACLETEMGLAK